MLPNAKDRLEASNNPEGEARVQSPPLFSGGACSGEAIEESKRWITGTLAASPVQAAQRGAGLDLAGVVLHDGAFVSLLGSDSAFWTAAHAARAN